MINTVQLDYAVLERVFNMRRAEVDRTLAPYIVARPSAAATQTYKTSTVRWDQAGANYRFNYTLRVPVSNISDKIFLTLMDDNLITRDTNGSLSSCGSLPFVGCGGDSGRGSGGSITTHAGPAFRCSALAVSLIAHVFHPLLR